MFPVIDGERRLVGFMTLGDFASLAAEHDLDGLVRATDLMRPAVPLRGSDPVSRALVLMHELGVRELPVVDETGCVRGLVDEATIARKYMRVRRARTDPGASGVRPIVGPLEAQRGAKAVLHERHVRGPQ